MFNEIRKQFQQRRSDLKFQIAASKKETNRLAEPICSHILSGLNSQVQLLHANQKDIENKAKVFKTQLGKLQGQVTKWVGLYDQLNSSLKQLGDIVNWSQIMENDLQTVASAITKILSDS